MATTDAGACHSQQELRTRSRAGRQRPMIGTGNTAERRDWIRLGWRDYSVEEDRESMTLLRYGKVGAERGNGRRPRTPENFLGGSDKGKARGKTDGSGLGAGWGNVVTLGGTHNYFRCPQMGAHHVWVILQQEKGGDPLSSSTRTRGGREPRLSNFFFRHGP